MSIDKCKYNVIHARNEASAVMSGFSFYRDTLNDIAHRSSACLYACKESLSFSAYHSTKISPLNCSRCDSNVDVDAPICIGMYYNANINWIVAGQPE
ncbi:hypothetical protein [uncultured Duncaniella sp.]|uniref:hypothetical protein n=1 Tax=uncultured Duncaniella sp. TaxID=2768039 RepID=UPI0025B68AC1|nr:hypothetical protein [uncultured Duncaniella sp.]